MPTFKSAKNIAENALKTIGAFPSTQSQADEGELRTALEWLEMILNTISGYRTLAGFWRIVDIPITANVGDYLLPDYADAAQTQHVFSVSIVDDTGNVNPLTILTENESVLENLTDKGRPCRAVVTKDVNPYLKIYPTPTQDDQDNGRVIRIRIQTYHPTIDAKGNGDEKLLLRPAWYLWLTKKLSYEIGSGPVRRLQEGELRRFENDCERLESLLVGRDGQNTHSTPPVTQPMQGS